MVYIHLIHYLDIFKTFISAKLKLIVKLFWEIIFPDKTADRIKVDVSVFEQRFEWNGIRLVT